jgi:SAM-dependent methyltransferase
MLRNAGREERKRLYPVVYDEFHAKIPYLLYIQDDPTSAISPTSAEHRARRLLSRLAAADSTYLEIGPGGCKLARAMAEHVRTVYAVDVSMTAMLSGGALPTNLKPFVSDGTSVPVPENSVDVAFSANLIEHLHPDDAEEQLENVWQALKPGGRYVCKTPNRINGPHDVSGEFGHTTAVGFHLKEYAYSDIVPLFRRIGFDQIRGYVDLKGRLIFPVPATALIAFEWAVERTPRPLRSRLLALLPVKAVLSVRVCGRKPLKMASRLP